MDEHRLCDLVADAHGRVEGGHGLLEDHGDLLAPDTTHPPLVGADEVVVDAGQAHRAARVDVFGQQAHDGQPGQRLSRAGLPDEADPLATADAEGDVLDEGAVPHPDGEVSHIEDQVVALP